MDFALEVFTPKLYGEMWPLFEAHYGELANFKDIPLDPDVTHYDYLQKLGFLRVFTYRKDLQLFGYCVFVVTKHPHYSGSKQAREELVYISPKSRGDGVRFIKFCDESLKSEDVQAIYYSVNNNFDFSPILSRLGYEAVDTTYARRLF